MLYFAPQVLKKKQKQIPQISAYFAYFAFTLPTLYLLCLLCIFHTPFKTCPSITLVHPQSQNPEAGFELPTPGMGSGALDHSAKQILAFNEWKYYWKYSFLIWIPEHRSLISYCTVLDSVQHVESRKTVYTTVHLIQNISTANFLAPNLIIVE